MNSMKGLNEKRWLAALLIGSLSITSTFLADDQIAHDNFTLHQQAQDTIACILQDPVAYLAYINKQVSFHFDSLDEETLPKLKAILLNYEKESPISFLAERNNKTCSVNRAQAPQYRETFEKHMVEALDTRLSLSNDPLCYVGFGSGSTYQDLIILCKTLILHPFAQLSIHLIDPEYTFVANLYDVLNKDHIVDPKAYCDLEDYAQKLLNDERTNPRKYIRYEETDEQACHTPSNAQLISIQIQYIIEERAPKQFISLLKNAFPHAQLNLHLHKNSEEYLDYVKKYNLPYPDVICAVDFGYSSKAKQIFSEYLKLCAIALDKNQNSYNAYLGPLDNQIDKEIDNSIRLSSLSIHPLDEIESYEIDLPEGNTIHIYQNSEII